LVRVFNDVLQLRFSFAFGCIDWVQDKQRSKFAFEGLCWEKSFIPKVIWQSADRSSNISESLHFDVNLEGIRCTLVGGIKKGHHYDALKWSSLKVCVHQARWYRIILFILFRFKTKLESAHRTSGAIFRKIQNEILSAKVSSAL
jgi:hypothetical protein